MTFKKLFPFLLIGSLLYALFALAADDRVLQSAVVQFSQIVTPANPPANKNKIYFKSDDKAYRLDSLGNEVELGGGVGGADTEIQFNNSGALDGDPDLIWDYTNSQLRTGSAPFGNTKLDFINSGVSNAILMRLQDPVGSGDLLHVLDNTGDNLFKITNGIVAIGDPAVDFSVQYDAVANHSFEFLQGGGGFFRLGSDIGAGEFHLDNWDGSQYETAISIEGLSGDVVINTNQDPVHNFIVRGDVDPDLLTVDTFIEKVGIGTATPDAKLHVDGDAIISGYLQDVSTNNSIDSSNRILYQSDGTTVAANWNSGPVQIKQSIFESDADEITLMIKGDSGQTAPYLQVDDSTGGDIAHIDLDGNFMLTQTNSGLFLKEGGSGAKMGRDTLVAGTVTVNTTGIATSCEVFVTARGTSTLHGSLSVENVVAGTSFDIVSTSITDDSDVSWVIICDSST